MKPGLRTTEFVAVIVFGAIAILSGLDITDGLVNFHLNGDMMADLKYVVLAYVGGRSIIKTVEQVKKPQSDLADEVANKLVEKAK